MEEQTESLPSRSHLSPSEAECDDEKEPELLCVSWNQRFNCFAAATSNGLRVYNCDPLKELFRRELKGGTFGIVEMLFRTNIFALVGSGKNSRFPSSKVMFYNDYQNRWICELSFKTDVRAVKLRTDIVIVTLDCKIYVYRFVNFAPLGCFETLPNPKGLCCLSYHSNSAVLACPGMCKGEVRVENLGSRDTKYINAHDSDLACIALTLDGVVLATASLKGTLIRIFNTTDGTRLQEVRRGTDRADIYSIALSPNLQWLGVSSDKGTVHLFKLRVGVSGENYSDEVVAGQDVSNANEHGSTPAVSLVPSHTSSNSSSSLWFMRGVLPKYFSSERSFAQFHLPEGVRHITAFGAQNTVMIIGMDGSFYRCSFDPVNGGEMQQKEYVRFLQAKCPNWNTT